MNSVIFQYLDNKKSQLKTNISENKRITKIREKMATEDPTKRKLLFLLYFLYFIKFVLGVALLGAKILPKQVLNLNLI